MSEVNGPPGSARPSGPPGPSGSSGASSTSSPHGVSSPHDASSASGARPVGGWTRFVTARPRLSLLAALVITALAVFAGSGVADRMGSGGWQAPDAESSYATEALEREFPASQPNLLLLVDSGTASVDDPAVAAEAARITERLAGEPGISGVTSYWQTKAPPCVPRTAAKRSSRPGSAATRRRPARRSNGSRPTSPGRAGR